MRSRSILNSRAGGKICRNSGEHFKILFTSQNFKLFHPFLLSLLCSLILVHKNANARDSIQIVHSGNHRTKSSCFVLNLPPNHTFNYRYLIHRTVKREAKNPLFFDTPQKLLGYVTIYGNYKLNRNRRRPTNNKNRRNEQPEHSITN